MRKTTSRFANLAAAAGLLLFAACSDSAGPGSGEISAGEAAEISDYLVGEAFSGWDFSQLNGGGGGAALQSGTPVEIDFAVDVASECPEGGTIGVSGAIQGTIDDQTLAGDLSLEVITSATECGIVAEGTGFTIDTNPDLTLSGDFSFADGALVGESTFTYTGAVQWASEDGRSGGCTYDVSVAVSPGGSSVTSGTVCGTSL